MRGYLHGGIIIDLIGQKGPTSKLHLVLLDILILLLQCLMLTVHVERERLSAVLTAFTKGTPLADEPRATIASTQNIDAEERGVMTNVTGVTRLSRTVSRQRTMETAADVMEYAEAMERAQLLDERPPTESEQDYLDRARLLEEPPSQEDPEDDHPLDMFWTGTAVLSEFHIIDTLKKQWADYGNASASALQTVGFSAEFAATTANRRINAASERFQRNIESLTR